MRASPQSSGLGFEFLVAKNPPQKKKKEVQILKKTQPEDKLISQREIRIQVQISTETSN